MLLLLLMLVLLLVDKYRDCGFYAQFYGKSKRNKAPSFSRAKTCIIHETFPILMSPVADCRQQYRISESSVDKLFVMASNFSNSQMIVWPETKALSIVHQHNAMAYPTGPNKMLSDGDENLLFNFELYLLDWKHCMASCTDDMARCRLIHSWRIIEMLNCIYHTHTANTRSFGPNGIWP